MQKVCLLTALLWSFSSSFVFADGCIWPRATLVMADKIQQCDHLLLGKWIGGDKVTKQRRGSSKFEIVEIGFSRCDRFKTGQVVEIPQYIAGSETANYALMGPKDRPEAWYAPSEVSSEGWKYLSKLPLPTTDPKVQAERLLYFLSYLEHPDPMVSDDAFAEFAAEPYDLILPLKDKFPREKILSWLANPKTPVTRIGFYGLMAGLCGKPKDAVILEKKIVVIDADYRQGIDGVMAGYLLISGEAGLKVLEDTKMRARVAQNAEGIEIPLPFSETYAAMQALRFMWTHEPDRLPKERLKQSMQVLLDRPELTDLVIRDLARWQDWSVQDRLMTMYEDEKFSTPAVQRTIVRYLYYCSQDDGKPATDGTTATRPEHALKAEANLKILEEKDPTTVAKTMRFLIVVKTAPTDKMRPAPILANAERLERIAAASSRGLMGCGEGMFQFIDHVGKKRRIQSGLDPIHVFGGEIDAKVLSAFLDARAKANEIKEGPMYGQRRFLLVTILEVVALCEDARFIDLLAPLLDDSIHEVQGSVQNALVCIGDRNAARRKQILEMLSTHNWNPEEFRSADRCWLPEDGKQGSKD